MTVRSMNTYGCVTVLTTPIDACEEMGIDDAHQEHLDMEAAMDVEDIRTLSSDSRSLKTKQLISAAVLECIKVDREGALRMLEAYRKKYVFSDTEPAFTTLTQVAEFQMASHHGNIQYRRDRQRARLLLGAGEQWRYGVSKPVLIARLNANWIPRAYYAMLEFALGIIVTDEEYEMMAEPIAHVERCMLLTNDYWSWPRERKQAETQEAGKVFNLIWFLMKTEGCTEQEAKTKVHDMVHEEEQKWVQSKTTFYEQHPNLRPDLVKFLENLHTALAGNDYWSSQCYRHNDWEHIPELPQDDDAKLHELAELGRAIPEGQIPSKVLGLGPTTGTANTIVVQRKASVGNMSSDGSQSLSTSTSSESSAICDSASSLSTPPSPIKGQSSDVDPDASAISGASVSLDSSVLNEPIKYIKSMPSKNLRCESLSYNVVAKSLTSRSTTDRLLQLMARGTQFLDGCHQGRHRQSTSIFPHPRRH